jgi:hypothetical protein
MLLWKYVTNEFLIIPISRDVTSMDLLLPALNLLLFLRHDKVCTHLHYSICKAFGIETTDKWYKHMPMLVYEEYIIIIIIIIIIISVVVVVYLYAVMEICHQ